MWQLLACGMPRALIAGSIAACFIIKQQKLVFACVRVCACACARLGK